MKFMKIAGLALMLTCACVATCFADVYDDANQAVKTHQSGDLDTAFDMYTKIIDSGKLKDEKSLLAYMYINRATIWMMRGNSVRALPDYEKSIEIKPDQTAYFNRALIYAEMGDTDKAIQDLDKAIELFPRYANAYKQRGLLYLDQGQGAKARADLKKAKILKMKILLLENPWSKGTHADL